MSSRHREFTLEFLDALAAWQLSPIEALRNSTGALFLCRHKGEFEMQKEIRQAIEL